jgi:hypothetical protein
MERDIEAAYGFVANPSLSDRHNASSYLATMAVSAYFHRPNTMAFYDLTSRLKPPKNLRSLLCINLKFIPNPPKNVSWATFREDTIPRFDRDLKIKVFLAGKGEEGIQF